MYAFFFCIHSLLIYSWEVCPGLLSPNITKEHSHLLCEKSHHISPVATLLLLLTQVNSYLSLLEGILASLLRIYLHNYVFLTVRCLREVVSCVALGIQF